MKKLLGFFLLILFTVSYRQLYYITSHTSFSIWLGIQMVIICIQSIFYHYNFMYLSFFTVNFISWYLEKKQFHIAWGWLACTIGVPLVYHGYITHSFPFLNALPFVVVILAAPFGIRSMNKRMELESELDEANAKIKELVKREERTRIARDLHDTLGHTLSLITLKSQLVERLITKDKNRAKQEVKEIELTSRIALDQVRELVTSMKSHTIMEELIYVQDILQTANIQVHTNINIHMESLPIVEQSMLSLCLREAVTNIVKHSKASYCWIDLKDTVENTYLIVADNGIGQSREWGEGNGLKGMKERLSLINGTLTVHTTNGSVLEMQVPKVKKDVETYV
ncbi:sensor histidine kinase [Virgibacillus sp. AGTR]|uniref:sensor histidine kinase n=1 Tax=Virgibacillus sp. AGTR TaxID=2812055 RepID=UPI001D04C169|nr:sensor histidine kinase [Virgibacillus sp. AGTR]MCC2252357.1 sensor histidine kinase [Virgibacillus sp. AGTR]